MREHVCDQCGAVLRDGRPTGLRRVPDREVEVQRFGLGAAADSGVSLAEFVQPARAATVSADVVVPLLQSLVSGGAAAALTVLPTIYFDLSWLAPLLAFSLAVTGVWLKLLAESRQSLWQVERYQREPVESAAPTTKPTEISVRLAVSDRQSVRYAHLPIEHEKLKTVARGLLGGRSFAVSTWCGNGKPLSRSQFETLREWLLSNGYAQWRDGANRQLGIDFTARGQALLKGLSES